jgi:hypothetical protein
VDNIIGHSPVSRFALALLNLASTGPKAQSAPFFQLSTFCVTRSRFALSGLWLDTHNAVMVRPSQWCRWLMADGLHEDQIALTLPLNGR